MVCIVINRMLFDSLQAVMKQEKVLNYHKILKIRTHKKIAVIILKLEQYRFTTSIDIP